MCNISPRLCPLVILGVATFLGRTPARADDLTKAIELQVKLAEVRKFKAITDPKTTLNDALSDLMKEYNVLIDVNELPFKYEQVMDVPRTPIAETAIPAFTGTLSQLLMRLLAKIPVPSLATYVIRGDRIEITTRKFQYSEFYRNRPAVGDFLEPMPPLVHASISNVPLTEALRDLARTYTANVVVDVRAAKDAATTVTADFANVPLDTAVTVLADMCGLTAVELGNVLYVTTRDNGRALQLDQEKRRLKAPEKAETAK